ncbi:MAG: ATP-binding cassette domain-containing protein, partial [Burkholderiales bacterium]
MRDACIDTVVAQRPGGLDAQVQARGRNFSGGQRQRLEIARALMRKPAVVILDEATDALDPALEAAIRANICKRGCTLIMISHRSSTLAACRRVVALERGKIAFDGSPERFAALAQHHEAARAQFTPAATLSSSALAAESCPVLRLAPGQEQALADAVCAVARAQGMAMQEASPAALAESLPLAQCVADLARQHGMHMRRIRIVDKQQWHMDHGPLIAKTRGDNQVVALLPDGNGYRVSGGNVSGLRISAANLHGEAYCLYADLAAASVPQTPLAWLATCLGDARRDLWRATATSAALWLLLLLPAPTLYWLLTRTDPTTLPVGKVAVSAVLVVLAAGLITWARQLALLRVDSGLESSLMRMLYQHIVKISPAFVRSLAPEKLARGLAGFPRLLDQVRGTNLQALLDGALVLPLLLLFAVVDPRLAALALLLMLPALV